MLSDKKINQYAQEYAQKLTAGVMAAINQSQPCGHHLGCIQMRGDGTGHYCVACEAVAAEREACAEIAQRECSAAHVVAIGQDVAAAIRARGESDD